MPIHLSLFSIDSFHLSKIIIGCSFPLITNLEKYINSARFRKYHCKPKRLNLQ
jgi:hypothetical protein